MKNINQISNLLAILKNEIKNKKQPEIIFQIKVEN